MSEPPETTEDGRYLVIDGRRWRATDPAIPQARREELTRALMAWRREVRRTISGTEEEARRAASRGWRAPRTVAPGSRQQPNAGGSAVENDGAAERRGDRPAERV